jgi:hypothetical protein
MSGFVPHEVDVVGERHERPRAATCATSEPAAFVSSSASAPERRQRPHRDRELRGRDALVEVRAPLEHRDRDPGERPEVQHARVAGHGALREAVELGVGEGDRVLHRVGDRAEPRAQARSRPRVHEVRACAELARSALTRRGPPAEAERRAAERHRAADLLGARRGAPRTPAPPSSAWRRGRKRPPHGDELGVRQDSDLLDAGRSPAATTRRSRSIRRALGGPG